MRDGFVKRGVDGVKRKIRIQKVCGWSITITVALAILFVFISVRGGSEFSILKNATEQYILCEHAAEQLKEGSDYLTEQVRLYAMTGQTEYMEAYFEEVNETRRREEAVQLLKQYFNGTDTFESLQAALNCSQDLTEIERYSIRLRAEATDVNDGGWPEEIKAVALSQNDQQLSKEEKIAKAQRLVSDSQYQDVRTEIEENVSECMDKLTTQTKNRQGRATTIFWDMYRKLEISIAVMVVLMLTIWLMVRNLVVKPLLSYNESIKEGVIFPVIGSAELQNLAETYNKVYLENQEIQKLIRHQAEHDALTDVLNRGSFENVLLIYERGDAPFALILVDVDVFKSVNDTYGHAAGDEILKKVANLLQKTFRSIDYVCRIGGDEFAIVMVEMTSDLQYTIEEKIEYINQELAKEENGLPKVSISVGIAFADRENPGESIFNGADKALYFVKENGRGGYAFYGSRKDEEKSQEKTDVG